MVRAPGWGTEVEMWTGYFKNTPNLINGTKRSETIYEQSIRARFGNDTEALSQCTMTSTSGIANRPVC